MAKRADEASRPSAERARRDVCDETLLAELRRLSVAERLRLNDSMVRTALNLRSAFARRGARR